MFSESQERDMIVGKELANALEKNITGKEDMPRRWAVRIPKGASRGRVHTGDTEAAHLSTDTKPEETGRQGVRDKILPLATCFLKQGTTSQ